MNVLGIHNHKVAVIAVLAIIAVAILAFLSVRRSRFAEERKQEEAEIQRQRVAERLASGNFSRQPSGLRRAITGLRSISGRHRAAAGSDPKPPDAPPSAAEDTTEH